MHDPARTFAPARAHSWSAVSMVNKAEFYRRAVLSLFLGPQRQHALLRNVMHNVLNQALLIEL